MVNCSVAQQTVTLSSLLSELVDRRSVAQLSEPAYVLKQVSSYDRHAVSPHEAGWFANDDRSQFLGEEMIKGRKEYILMDEEGPGVIVRFWETTFKRPGVFRIYFDNEADPRIVIPGYDLMKFPYPLGKALLIPHSSYEPLEKGGSTLYLPLPYAKHCKVTWEDADDPIKEPRYYQLNFRKYEKGTVVETFSEDSFQANKELIHRVNDELLHPSPAGSGKQLIKQGKISAGGALALSLPKGSAAVQAIVLQLKDKRHYTDSLLRQLYVKATFDGEETIYCPVSDFFGSGAGNHAIASWYRNVIPGGNFSCYWIMPYRRRASISLVNKSGGSIAASLQVQLDTWKWDHRSLYFHADWRSEREVRIAQSEADHPIEWDLNVIQGKGVFVGETMAVNNHMHKWYGEGDQKLWVDKETFPSEYGTGLEDYYNTSWAPVVLYQTPFANAPRADNADSFGQNTFTRTRNLDAVPFQTHFRFSVEMLGWENGTADVSATTYWYGSKGAKTVPRGH
ncbi:DUF2961 domain-containing protein [Olivibacter ginsenosidimutans]|uniref:DUF2961 domain-containing protein n=2 Tax=Olivibacter ginsenosidimutans TaxID=1176537 RepID=A0ABP9BQE0_9SPHI